MNEKVAQIFVTLLELKIASIQELSKITGIPEHEIIRCIGSMNRRFMVEFFKAANGIKYYRLRGGKANYALMGLLSEKELELDKTQKVVEEIVELSTGIPMKKIVKEPQIWVMGYEERMQKWKELIERVNYSALLLTSEFSYVSHWIELVEKENIAIKIITPPLSEEVGLIVSSIIARACSKPQIRYISHKKFQKFPRFYVFDSRHSLVFHPDGFGFYCENPLFAKILEEHFSALWKKGRDVKVSLPFKVVGSKEEVEEELKALGYSVRKDTLIPHTDIRFDIVAEKGMIRRVLLVARVFNKRVETNDVEKFIKDIKTAKESESAIAEAWIYARTFSEDAKIFAKYVKKEIKEFGVTVKLREFQ